MSEDKINKNEVLTQNSTDDNKKENETKNINEDKKNEVFVQVTLSVFSGILGGAALNILRDDTFLSILTIAVVGFIMLGVVIRHYRLGKKTDSCIFIMVSLVVALFACLAYCVQK